MNEVFPVVAGAALGAAVFRVPTAWLRAAIMAVLSVLLGMTASLISGELEISFGFIPVDVAEVAFVAVLALGVCSAWQRRPLRLR